MGKVVAVIGASSDRRKFGNRAVRAFRRQGYTVVPINPNETQVEGLKTYASVLDVPESIDMATAPLVGRLYTANSRPPEHGRDTRSRGGGKFRRIGSRLRRAGPARSSRDLSGATLEVPFAHRREPVKSGKYQTALAWGAEAASGVHCGTSGRRAEQTC